VTTNQAEVAEQMKIGLVGLPGSGKSTCFCLLSGKRTESHGRDSQIAVVPVPDARTERIYELCHPAKMVQPELTFVDLLAVHSGDSGAGEELELVKVAGDADAFAIVVQCFGELDHSGQLLDPKSDLETVLLEMSLTDLTIVERRLRKLESKYGDLSQHEKWEQKVLSRCQEHLAGGQRLLGEQFTDEEEKLLRGFSLLTMKPLMAVFNVAEADLDGKATAEACQLAEEQGLTTLTLCAELEEEIAQLSPAEQADFLLDFGLSQPARDRFIRTAYELLDVITFFTVNENEVHAWTISQGTTALEAAGKIHSDMASGFVRAEVVPFEALDEHGSMATCREAGAVRLEGRDYPVQDGDILYIRFTR